MTDLVEELAKAMFDARLWPAEGQTWETIKESVREVYRHDAQSCIDKIDALGLVIVPKEPTEAMIDAGHECGDWGPGINCDEQDAGPRNCWQAMIQAASTAPHEAVKLPVGEPISCATRADPNKAGGFSPDKHPEVKDD